MDSPIKNKGRLRQWVEKRWPLSPVLRWGTTEEIPGGTKFAYILGSTTLVLFVVLVITGVWQLLYYVPTVDHAYDSVMFLRLQVPLGWLIHGLHYWSAQAFIVVMGLHVVRVFIWAAYKKPRELTWVLGVVLLLLGAAFIFTGSILPWDTTGYWAGTVGTNMAGTVPLVGNFLKLLLRGGDAMGQMTLSRSFAVHVAILPALTVFFIVAHIVAFRQFGNVGPWKPKKPEKTGSFWPDQTFKDLLAVGLILMALICLSAFVRAPISGPADPLDNSLIPKPEWNFLFLYQALKAFKGSWEWVGTTVIPTLLVLLLFAVPFIDRNEKKNPFQRPVAMLSGFLFVAVILAMTFIGNYSGSSGSAPADSASTNQTATASTSAATPATPEGAPPVSTNAPAPVATASAPTNQVATPAASATTSAAPPVSTNAPAPAATALAPTNQVAATPTAASPATEAGQTNTATSAAHLQEGKGFFTSAGCVACHKIEGKGGTTAPDLSNEAKLGRTPQWLITQITDPAKHNPSTKMPAHKSLTESQHRALADYILNPTASAAAAGAGTATNADQQASASSAASAQEKQNTTNTTASYPPPAADAPATSVTLLKMIGDPKHGAVLFALNCAQCHGKDGEGNVPNPGSQAGVVAPLAPINRKLFSDDPLAFTENIDRIIQHGAPSPGPNPKLMMPAFGDTRALTLPMIANIEAYILSLNGVDAAKIIHPGITPLHFVEGTVALFALALLALGGLWVHYRTEGSAQPGGRPTPEEFQNLKHEVADLKHKLEERKTANPKDSSGTNDSQPGTKSKDQP